MSSKIAVSAALAFAIATAPFDARAQPSSSDAALAQSLFDQARTLMKEQRYAEACPKLAESQRLDPAPGTLLNLARCHELEGRIASAWAEYRDALAEAKKAGDAKREQYASTRLAGVAPNVSHVTIARADPNDATPIVVELDGEALGPAVLNTPVAVDPGEHRVTAHAPNKKAWTTSVVIGAVKADRRIEIPLLEDEPSPPPPVNVPVPVPVPPARPAEPVPAPAPAPDHSLSYALAGAGVAAIGVGAFAGFTASAKWSDRNAACTNDACTPSGLEADRAARRWAMVSDIGFAVGVVALGAATYLVFTAKPAKGVEVRAGVGPGSVVVGGRF